MSETENNNGDPSKWSQGFFQGQMMTETKTIHKRLDAFDKKFETVDNEAGDLWERTRAIEKDRTDCRECMDDKLRGMKIWSGIITGIQAAITFVWILLLKMMGLGPK